MTEPLATLVIVPRERFSYACTSLENILANTPDPFDLIYVDAGSPEPVRSFVETQARERGFLRIRTEQFLTPTQARNLGLAKAKTRYVVFLDNDVEVESGWLDALVRCAEETGASLVGPLMCERRPDGLVVHMAGGAAQVALREGQRRFVHTLRHADLPLEPARSTYRREPTELLEFHCMLARRSLFDRIGPLDEEILNTQEYVDLCWRAREAGGTIYFEPGARVTFVTSGLYEKYDLPYFFLRWSEGWTRASLRRLVQKWNLSPDDPFPQDQSRWIKSHCSTILEKHPGALEWYLKAEQGPSEGTR